jgi:hypothetical protein
MPKFPETVYCWYGRDEDIDDGQPFLCTVESIDEIPPHVPKVMSYTIGEESGVNHTTTLVKVQ